VQFEEKVQNLKKSKNRESMKGGKCLWLYVKLWQYLLKDAHSFLNILFAKFTAYISHLLGFFLELSLKFLKYIIYRRKKLK
jgi:hypothetical protein